MIAWDSIRSLEHLRKVTYRARRKKCLSVSRVVPGSVVTYKIKEMDDTPLEGTFYSPYRTTICIEWKKCWYGKRINCLYVGKVGQMNTTVRSTRRTSKSFEDEWGVLHHLVTATAQSFRRTKAIISRYAYPNPSGCKDRVGKWDWVASRYQTWTCIFPSWSMVTKSCLPWTGSWNTLLVRVYLW